MLQVSFLNLLIEDERSQRFWYLLSENERQQITPVIKVFLLVFSMNACYTNNKWCEQILFTKSGLFVCKDRKKEKKSIHLKNKKKREKEREMAFV